MHGQRRPQLHPLSPPYFQHQSPSMTTSAGSGSSRDTGPITPVDADEVFIGQLWEQVYSSKRRDSDNFIPAAIQQAFDEDERERERERELEKERERERAREARERENAVGAGARPSTESMAKGYGSSAPVISAAPNSSRTPTLSRRRSIVYRESSDKRHMLVILDLPGVDKADVHVSFQYKRLVVSYKIIRETEHCDYEVTVQEILERRVTRAITIQDFVRPSSVTANWKDHRLFITYPTMK